MKRKLITLLLLMAGLTAVSQNCKYEINDIDKFTGKMTKLTKKTHLFENSQVVGYVNLQKIENDYSLILECDGSFLVKRTIKPGSDLYFLLEDGKKIILKERGGIFPIKIEDLTTLMKTKTVSVRFTLDTKEGDLQKDMDVKKGDSIRLTNLVKCIL